jgi:hypothetical protein
MDSPPVSRYLTTFSELVEASRPSFRRYFWVGTTIYGILIVSLGIQLAVETLAGAVIISVVALVPWYLWVKGTAKGLPIWPMFTLTALWAYALPLVTEHPVVMQFPPFLHLTGSLTIAAFLAVGTIVWLPFVHRLAPSPPRVRVLPIHRGRYLLFVVLCSGLALSFFSNSGSLDDSGPLFSVVRAFALGLSNLSIFYFGYQMGARQLGVFERKFFIALLFVSVLVSLTSMLLVTGMSMILLAFISYFLGRGSMPLLPLLFTALGFYYLHAGKGNQRDQYWGEVMWRPIALNEYAVFFTDWIEYSNRALGEQLGLAKVYRNDTQTQYKLWERSSLIHLFLYIQYSTPESVPYLNGETYTVIPQLLIPRILLPSKAGSHYGNTVMAVQYGIMEAEDETGTSIGFGLICEAFANFGYLGCFLVPIVLGGATGWITRWCMSVPIMSFRFLFGVLCLGSAFQVEYTAGVLVSSLFQSAVALGAVALAFMRVVPLGDLHRLAPRPAASGEPAGARPAAARS